MHSVSPRLGGVLLGATLSLLAVFSTVIAGETATVHEVVIEKFKFIPAELAIETGDTVRWINKDIAPHTATGSDKSWDTKRLRKNEAGEITFTENGRFDYFCFYHPAMKAVILVRENTE